MFKYIVGNIAGRRHLLTTLHFILSLYQELVKLIMIHYLNLRSVAVPLKRVYNSVCGFSPKLGLKVFFVLLDPLGRVK